MDAERWRRIETLFADAVTKSGEARTTYLACACAGDHTMRAELESLLKAHAAGAETFLEPGTLAEHVVERDPQPLLTRGVRLGAFEIIAALDAGGMGAVYEARDTRLDRNVALKLVAPRSNQVNDGFKRFEREARAISRLADPHICTVYDIARASLPTDGEREVEFLVMELVRGETLAAVIARGPLPEDLVVQYAIEIADALACAHREGIVHRAEAAEHHDHGGRPQAARLRPRSVHARIRDGAAWRGADRAACHRRHGPIHGARASPRRGGRRPRRCLQPRRGHSRDAHWRPSVRPSHDTRNAARHPERTVATAPGSRSG